MTRTIQRAVRVEGRGLFTGEPARVVFRPGAAGSGVVFLHQGQRVPALIGCLSPLPPHPAFEGSPARNTNLALSGDPQAPQVRTTEHILAAIAGLGLTDVEIELEGPEIPIGDGSAEHFCRALAEAGFAEIDDVRPIRVSDRIEVAGAGGSIVCEPAGDDAEFCYRLDYSESCAFVGKQEVSWRVGDDNGFLGMIAPARTFSLRREAEAMRAAGLFTEFSPRDLLVIDDTGPIDNELRTPHEPACHKLLDLIGDLALVGRPVHASITAERSGHALNHELARQLAAIGG